MQAKPNSLHSEIMRKEALRLPRLPIKKKEGGGGGGGGGLSIWSLHILPPLAKL